MKGIKMHDRGTGPTPADLGHHDEGTGTGRIAGPGHDRAPDRRHGGDHDASGRRRLWWVLAAALAPWATAAVIVVGERMA